MSIPASSLAPPAPGPEGALLLLTARATLAAADQERLRSLLASKVDWPLLFELGLRHRVLALFYHHVNRVAPDEVPREILVDLWQAYERNRRRNEAMMAELQRLLGALGRSGISAVPYKGPALAQALFGDVALREFEDLDILVPIGQVLGAKAALEQVGYVADHALTPDLERAYLASRTQYHRVLAHPLTGVVVELHWKTDPDFAVEQLRGPDARLGPDGFSAEELLLIVCLHGTKHHGHRLAWIVDAAEVLRREPSLDWPRLHGLAARLRCTRRLHLGLLLAHRLLDAPLPGQVRATLADPGLAALADFIIARLFRSGVEELRGVRRLRFEMRLYDCAWHRARHVVKVGLTPTLVEWSRWPLPRPLFALYLPLRMARLAKKYGVDRLGRSRPAA